MGIERGQADAVIDWGRCGAGATATARGGPCYEESSQPTVQCSIFTILKHVSGLCSESIAFSVPASHQFRGDADGASWEQLEVGPI
jgi:hypothetical protein